MDKLVENEVFSLSKEVGFTPKKEKVGYSYYDEEVGCFGGKEACAIYEDVKPTQTTLKSWLSENHNIFVEPQLDRTSAPKFAVEIYKYSHFGNYDKVIQKDWYLYRTYEEALEVGLLEGLKIIKNK